MTDLMPVPDARPLVVGVDVGGTFTDLVVVNEATGELRVAKVPTTVRNQADGVLAALRETGAAMTDVGLVITRGFRDVLELGRRTRPHPYGLSGSFEPLVTRELRLEVDERIDADGVVVRPLDEDGVRRATQWLREAGAEALVIHFVHAYVN